MFRMKYFVVQYLQPSLPYHCNLKNDLNLPYYASADLEVLFFKWVIKLYYPNINRFPDPYRERKRVFKFSLTQS